MVFYGRDVESRARSDEWRTMRTLTRWVGIVAAVACTFLSQELIRVLFEHMDRVSSGEQISGGWMRLSGASWPATWIYWASHLWVFAVLRDWRRSPGPSRVGKVDLFLAFLVLFEILLIHLLIAMFRGHWEIEPALLW